MSDVNPANDPHSYTDGRWLNHDRFERESRKIQFNFSALGYKVVELCPRANYVAQCVKKDGGFSRVLVITMDNGQRVVARLFTSIAGPRRLMTNSEVATMTYCKHKPSNWLGN